MTHETRRRWTYIALGDSLTAGTGAEDGEGFVHVVHKKLVEMFGPSIELRKFGTVGAKTDELLHQLRDSPGMQAAVRKANLITLTAGGNDLMQAALPFFMDGEHGQLASSLRSYVANLRQLLHLIHALRQGVDLPYMVMVVGLYNPLPQFPIAAKWVRRYNKYAQMLSRGNSVYVDVYDAFLGNEYRYLSEDLVHPNAAGYKAIAASVIKSIPPYSLQKIFA